MKDSPNPPAAAPARSVEALTEALAAPFDLSEVKFKPAVVSGNRAMALAYVDARVIQDRLDEVLGVLNWKDEYTVLPDGSVKCRLSLRINGEWICKEDVGGQSEQPDEGDRQKAAFSDALKRAAVKFGVGRYLYRLPAQWVDYDPKRKTFVRAPALPRSAIPMKEAPAKPAPAAAPPPAPAKAPAAAAPPAPRTALHTLPAHGAELQRRLYDYDARLAGQGLCQKGDLVKHVVQAGVKAGFDADLAAWTGPAIALAVDETKAFEAQARKRAGERAVA